MPPSLGQRLKHAREQRGLSLRDVEHKTRIPHARLQDLEEDKLNNFGGMTYAKSFLRTYSTMLDVDAGDVLNELKAPPLGGTRDYRYLVETQGPWVARRSGRNPRGSTSAQLTPGKSFLFAAIVCTVFGLFIGGAVLANAYFNSKTAAAAAAAKEQDSVAAKPSPLPEAPGPEQAFNRLGESLTAETDGAFNPQPAPGTSPAQPAVPPVIEESRRAVPVPPKAEAVR